MQQQKTLITLNKPTTNIYADGKEVTKSAVYE